MSGVGTSKGPINIRIIGYDTWIGSRHRQDVIMNYSINFVDRDVARRRLSLIGHMSPFCLLFLDPNFLFINPIRAATTP